MSVFDVCSGLILFFIIIFGIVGNILSFIVWSNGRRCKKLPGGIYLRTLAISDTTALLIPAMNEAISLLTQFNPKQEYDFFCRVEIVGRHFGLLVGSWIIVTFTVERTIAIMKTKISAALMSRTATIILMVAIFFTNLMLNLPFGIVYKLTKVESSTVSLGNGSDIHGNNSSESGTEIVGFKQICTTDRTSFFSYLNWYHIWFMDWVLIFIFPFAIITGCNLAVLFVLISKRKHPNSKLGSSVIKGVTKRAVVIGISHCITTGPFSISVLIPGYFSRALTVKYSQEYYINRVCLILAYLNHAINVLLYNFFSSEFRKDLRGLICKTSNSVHPDSTTKPRVTKSDVKASTKDRPLKTFNFTDKDLLKLRKLGLVVDSGSQSNELTNFETADGSQTNDIEETILGKYAKRHDTGGETSVPNNGSRLDFRNEYTFS